MVYSDYTERQLLFYSQNYKRPATQKSIEHRAFLFNAHFNYSAALRALRLYRTVVLAEKAASIVSYRRATVIFERR